MLFERETGVWTFCRVYNGRSGFLDKKVSGEITGYYELIKN